MKNYWRKALAATVLVLVLACSTMADDGVMHTGLPAPPPPPATNGGLQMGATDADMHTDPAASSTVTEITLILLQSLTARF